jgi:hypothetical protein
MSSSRGDFVLREEERSVESKEFNDDDRDFIAPEGDVEESMDLALEASDVLGRARTSERLGVSIFNTSALGGGSIGSSAPLLVRVSDDQSVAESGSDEEEEEAENGGQTMRRHDLNPSLGVDDIGATSTGGLSSITGRQSLAKPTVRSGEKTQAVWLTEQPIMGTAGKTTRVDLTQALAHDPQKPEDLKTTGAAGQPQQIR